MKHWPLLLLAGCSGGVTPSVPVPPVTCTHMLSWTLTEDRPDITYGTLYVTQIPWVETKISMVQVDAYILLWGVDVTEGEWFYRMTVTTEDGQESSFSNEVSQTCP